MCFAISYWSAGKSSGDLIFNISKSAAVQMVAFKKLYKDCTLETRAVWKCPVTLVNSVSALFIDGDPVLLHT